MDSRVLSHLLPLPVSSVTSPRLICYLARLICYLARLICYLARLICYRCPPHLLPCLSHDYCCAFSVSGAQNKTETAKQHRMTLQIEFGAESDQNIIV